jgi:hypothetical protein
MASGNAIKSGQLGCSGDIPAEIITEHLQEVIPEESCGRLVKPSWCTDDQTGPTISRSVSQQNQPKIRMNHDIVLPFPLEPDPTSIGKAHFTVSGETPEHGDDMFRSFVCLVDDYDSA